MEFSERAERICECMEQITEVMLEMEKEFEELYTCAPDYVETADEKITQYRQIADELFDTVNELCAGDGSGILAKAADVHSSRKDVDDSAGCVFEARQEINAVMNRIMMILPRVERRIRREKDKSLENIRNNNSSQSANVSKYFSTVISGDDYSYLKKSRSI